MSLIFELLEMIDDRQNLTFALIAAAFLAPVAATVAGFIA